MLHSLCEAGRWTLRSEETLLLDHSEQAPFATAIRRERTYTANRGTVKEQVVEAERVPLTAVREADGALTLTGGGRRLQITVSECDGGAELALSGEEGWAYEFRLPAIDGEAVFGGGEQYRKTNLRGEHVVNFVSEHIKAATVIEKALLPRAMYREKPHAEIGSYAPMPVFVTDRGRLFLFETNADGISHFDGDVYRFTFDACPEKLVLLHGARYETLSGLLAARIPNRQYLPDWCHDGMILGIQGGTETVLRKVHEMLDAGAAAVADRAIEALASALKCVVYLLDPGKLILYGAIFEHPYYLSRLTAEMEIGVDAAHAVPMEKSEYNGALEYAAAGLLAAERFLQNGGIKE